MSRKLICLFTFIIVLGTAGNAWAELLGYWRLDEGSGTTVSDSSGSGIDGTFEGDPEWVAGHSGLALELDGDDWVNFGTPPELVLTGDISITCWVNPSAFDGRQGFAGLDTGYVFKVHEGGVLCFTTPGISDMASNASVIEAGIWQHVAVSFQPGQDAIFYINGVETERITGSSINAGGGPFRIGSNQWSENLIGLIDEVRIYNHILTESEILAAMEGAVGYPYALGPYPTDGAIYPDTWVSLTWKSGDFAVSHDVYMGENFDDVNDATRDSDVFRGNQGLGFEFFIAGFFGYPYPDGLVNGTTYYWRIDEVNDADPNSPWKGNVWSFTVPPKTAYDPIPSDNSKFVDIEGTTLSWTAGYGSKLHFIYFGDDYDTVANASGAPPSVSSTYSPGPLEIEKTYYWRVDESDGTNTFTGNVWSFTTAKEGGGLQAEYYHWSGDFPPAQPFQVFVAKEIVSEINWNWGDPGSPNPLVNDNNFGCRFTGEVEAAFTETYTFYMTTDDGQRLWIDDQPVIDMWVQQGMTEHRGTIDLVAGQRYSIEAWMYENAGGAGCELRWSSPSTPKQIVPQAALSPPVRAMGPSPTNGATGTKMTPILKWNAGIHAASHEVYFGTDANAVANADKNSPEYKGTKVLGDESFDPGKLAWNTQYFWRIDEVNAVNPDSPWIGNLWNFTTGDFIVVDNFEDYDVDKPIWEYWLDGVGFGAPGTPDFFAGNGTGAAVGDESSPSYMEEIIVHGDSKSMPVAYDNNKQGFAKYSEVELTLTAPRNWTEEEVAELSIWFRGYPTSTGSFVEGPAGTYTMTGSGTDIWGTADEFHFAYKALTGAGSIVARVDSVENTNGWAKAGVMIRETLNADSTHAMMVVTPLQGVSFQRRNATGASSASDTTGGISAPYWVKIERDLSGNFTASSSTNGSTWQMLGTPDNITMGANVYLGLAVTSHDAALTCQAVFSNVATTGNVTGQWANQDIGILSNDAEPLYVAVSNSAGAPAVVVHDDPAAANIDTWTEWVVPLSAFADQGVVLTNVDRIAIGLGTQDNMTIPGGSGKMYIDDIRLYQPREAAE